MEEEKTTVRCVWCGWQGDLEDLDMDETDAPAYCPECGHGQFDIRPINVHPRKEATCF